MEGEPAEVPEDKDDASEEKEGEFPKTAVGFTDLDAFDSIMYVDQYTKSQDFIEQADEEWFMPDLSASVGRENKPPQGPV